MIPWCRSLLFFLAALALAGCPQRPPADAAWQPLGPQRERTVSGLARDGDGFVVVHDNKHAGEPRMAFLSPRNGVSGLEYRALSWHGAPLPVDLEAIVREPGDARAFLAATSRGDFFRVLLREDTAQATTLASLPCTDEIEGLDVWSIEARLCLIWAERGEDRRPATLSWGWFDAHSGTVTGLSKTTLAMPSLGAHTRHVSDLRVTPAGALVVSSATDPGNRGPFSSAVWEAGQFRAVEGAITFQPAAPPRRLHFAAGQKIEAIEWISPGVMALGADNEDLGGAILFHTPALRPAK